MCAVRAPIVMSARCVSRPGPAALRCADPDVAFSDEDLDNWDLNAPQLWQRFYTILVVNVFPAATRANPKRFRDQFKRIEIANVFRTHSRPLRRVFVHYAMLHASKQREERERERKREAKGGAGAGAGAAVLGAGGSGSGNSNAPASTSTGHAIDFSAFYQMMKGKLAGAFMSCHLRDSCCFFPIISSCSLGCCTCFGFCRR